MEEKINTFQDRIRMGITVDAKGKVKLDITVEGFDGDPTRIGKVLSDTIVNAEKAVKENNWKLVKDISD